MQTVFCLQIIAVTEKQLRELRSQKEQLAIKLSQETENLRLVIEQNETQVKEQTSRQLARLDAELSEFLAVYNQETENQQKEILHNKTVRTLASTRVKPALPSGLTQHTRWLVVTPVLTTGH